jgi:GNAT superfamily N-acetyltransferase
MISGGSSWEHARVLSHRLRPAAEADIGFLADVVVEATRAQGRLPRAFDERQWRDGFDAIELCGIQLLPGVQGNGIGTAIIEDLKAQAAAAGIPLDLGVERDNPDARRLYLRLGFAEIGETDQEFRLRWDPRP